MWNAAVGMVTLCGEWLVAGVGMSCWQDMDVQAVLDVDRQALQSL